MSVSVASATLTNTCSVAGLMTSMRPPDSGSTHFPSMNRLSGRAIGAVDVASLSCIFQSSRHGFPLSSLDDPDPNGITILRTVSDYGLILFRQGPLQVRLRL